MHKERRGLNSTSLIRSYNIVSVLQTIYREGTCSRARLTEVTKMSPSTVTRIVSELLTQGIITEHGIGESNGGRKPVFLKLCFEKLSQRLSGFRSFRSKRLLNEQKKLLSLFP